MRKTPNELSQMEHVQEGNLPLFAELKKQV